MNKRRFGRFVASIFGAALLFATIGLVPAAARPTALDPSVISVAQGENDDEDNGEDSDHRVVCTGTLSPDGNTCTVSQGTLTQATDNHAVCKLFSSNPNVTQKCIIEQKSGTGKNHARVRMRIAQEKTLPPFPGICPFPLRSLPNSNQNGCQILKVTQTSVSGSNSLDAVMRITQEIDEGSTQRQNAGQDHTVTQNSTSGAQLAKVHLFQTQDEEAKVIAKQFQRSTANGDITQFSTGKSRLDRTFRAHQKQKAPAGSTQHQDPDDFCCSGSGTSTENVSRMRVDVSQTQNLSPADQRDRLDDSLSTTGSAAIDQTVTRNGVTTKNSCSGSPGQGGCHALMVCSAECVPTSGPGPRPGEGRIL